MHNLNISTPSIVLFAKLPAGQKPQGIAVQNGLSGLIVQISHYPP
jgi:hypothetical protein